MPAGQALDFCESAAATIDGTHDEVAIHNLDLDRCGLVPVIPSNPAANKILYRHLSSSPLLIHNSPFSPMHLAMFVIERERQLMQRPGMRHNAVVRAAQKGYSWRTPRSFTSCSCFSKASGMLPYFNDCVQSSSALPSSPNCIQA